MTRLDVIEARLNTGAARYDEHDTYTDADNLRYLLKVARAADDLCEATGGWRWPPDSGLGRALTSLRTALEARND